MENHTTLRVHTRVKKSHAKLSTLFLIAIASTSIQATSTEPDTAPTEVEVRNRQPGCEYTPTAYYSDYIKPGWSNERQRGTFVVASDPQYPRTRNSAGQENGNNPNESIRMLSAVFSDIAALRRSKSDYVPVLINGDLTEFGHGNERKITQELFRTLSGGHGGPLFFPGLGNHDYQNNVNDCANNGCARDSVCDVINWTREIQPLSFDYRYTRPDHQGSLAYSIDVGKLHFIQLHNNPLYQTHFESGRTWDGTKRRFTITPSLDWLENDLRDARRRGQIIFINMHMREGWNAGNSARFRNLIQQYNVTAAFAGHYHGQLGRAGGTSNNFGTVPVFQSGALLNASYLFVEFNLPSMLADVYRVPSRGSYSQREYVASVSMKAGTALQNVDTNNPQQDN